jgi:hypothetical protein
VKGEEAAKTVHALGFASVYLATGFPANKFGDMPWITAVVGKDPPFKRSA